MYELPHDLPNDFIVTSPQEDGEFKGEESKVGLEKGAQRCRVKTLP